MCERYSGEALRRPVHASDLPMIKATFGKERGPLIEGIFKAMTDNLFVPVPVFVTVVDLVSRFLGGRYKKEGAFGAHIRFSALRPGTLERFQTREMVLIHDGVATFNMSDRNRRMLSEFLGSYGMALVMDCCCGSSVVPVEKLEEFLRSMEYVEGNKIRTLADSYGNLDLVSHFEIIPDEILPAEEKRAYGVIMSVSKRVVTENKLTPSDFIGNFLPGEIVRRIEEIPTHTTCGAS